MARRAARLSGPGDRGSASVYLIALMVLLCGLGLGFLSVARAVHARHVAGTAADLAALAGAGHAWYGERAACATAGRVSRTHRAHLAACALRGEVVEVLVEFGSAGLGGAGAAARVRARAGPADLLRMSSDRPAERQAVPR